MQRLLNRSNLAIADHEGKQKGDFNCWGGTLFVLGEIKTLEWVCGTDMEMFLDENTVKIDEDKMQIGDILATYNFDGLVHTATYTGKNRFWHKMGGGVSEFSNKQGVLDSYSYDHYEIRRLNK